jgi:hypothetical protein
MFAPQMNVNANFTTATLPSGAHSVADSISVICSTSPILVLLAGNLALQLSNPMGLIPRMRSRQPFEK